MKKQRKCVHNPLKLRRSKGLIRMPKTKMFRKRAMAQMLRIGRQMGLSGKTLEDLRALPLVLEHMAGPEWAGMSKAEKLIVEKWGFEVGTTMLKTMEMLTTCLRVELGCAEPAYLREQSRALMKGCLRYTCGHVIKGIPMDTECRTHWKSGGALCSRHDGSGH